MKTAKILSLLVGVVIAVMALALLSVYLFVNPNQFKGRIESGVKEATGRDLVLQGDIKLSVFPWVALDLGPASLGNPPGFGAEPFVSFQRASVRARLFPLLHEKLEVSRVEIDGLDVRMIKNAAGKGNWEGFGKSDAPKSGATPTTGSDSPLEGLAGIKITHARLSYNQYVLQNLSLETAPFLDGTVPISLKFEANRGVATESGTVDAKVDFSNPSSGHYRLAALNVVGQLNLAGDNRPIRWNVATPSLEVDLGGQVLALPQLTFAVAGAQMTASVQGSKIVDDPHFAGSLSLAPIVVREFIPRWGMTSPQTRDPRAFSQVSGSLRFAYGGNALKLNDLKLTLDDTHLQGSFAIDDLTTDAMQFALTADKMDADRYLPPEESATAKPAVVAAKASEKESAAKPLDAQGTFALGALQIAGLNLTNLKVTLNAKDNVMHVFPLQADVYGGHYAGDISVDSRTPVATVSMDEHLTGVDMAQLLAAKPKSVHLSGKGNFNIKAVAHGETADSVTKSLTGKMDAFIADGAVEGVDLGFQLGRAEALIKRQDVTGGQDTHRTKFDSFKVSADIVDGLATTKDLLISSPVLKVTGQGSTQLSTKAIDFSLLADTLRSTQGVPIQVPVKVTGTTADPVIRPDVEALAKGQIKQKLQEVLGSKLKGLFGKP